MSTVADTDLETWLDGEAEESEPCIFGRMVHEPCTRAPTWLVTWSCGCPTPLCDCHLKDRQEIRAPYGFYCTICGESPVYMAVIAPYGKGEA